MSSNGSDAEVLGKLLVALQTLDVLPDEERMASFLRLALREVPGLADVFVCSGSRVLPTDTSSIATRDLRCQEASPSSASVPPCMVTDRPDIHVIAMRTPRGSFGCLLLVVDDEQQFEAYRPFLINVGHMVATILESRGNARSLAEANARLNDLVDDLEDRVTERTTELQAAEERYRTTLATLPDAISTLRARRGIDGTIIDFEWTYANPAATGREPQTERVGTLLLAGNPEYRELGLFDAFCHVVATGEPVVMEVQQGGGAVLATIAECRASRLGDGVVVAFRDVTDRHATAKILADSEARYRLLTENASDVVMLLDPSWTYEWVSDSVTEVLGWRPTDLVGHAIEEFVHPDDLARFRQVVAEAVQSSANVEFRFHRADGTYHWVACRTRADLDVDGTPVAVVGALVDITDRKLAEARLTFAASHDPLTGLANRTMLVDEADRALVAGQRSGQTTALLMLDLDHFKNINDALGHGVGDELLSAVAGRISGSVRAADLVARPGGDEFVVLLRGLEHPLDAVRLAQRLVVQAREPVTAGGVELYATASVGIAEAIPGLDPARRAVDLIREADTAMYAAKVGGRDRVAQFTDDLRRIVDDRMRLESELRPALGRGELAVWYQPEIDLRDGTVRAAEALLRWHHPDGHVRDAAEFIDVAEDSGLILDIGASVLGGAIAGAATWATEGSPRVVLRVNLSPLELRELDLLTTLDEALAVSGLEPGLLCVEITETTVLSDSSTVQANLHGIHERGIELAIDDFGTGYGSLTYLRRYPVDVLKIDRSFVTHITTQAGDRDLVAGVVALAERLGISVTAEGIETVDQEDVVRSLGCAGAQGFLYSRALPIEQMVDFLRVRQT